MFNFSPIKEIASIRGDSDSVKKGSELQVMVICSLKGSDLPSSGNVSVNVLVSSDGAEFVQIGYGFEKGGYFYVDHGKCCPSDKSEIFQYVSWDSKEVAKEGVLNFNILLDRSVIESFLNEQKVITSMVNPANTTAPEDRTIEMVNNLNQYFTCNMQSWQLSL